MRVKNMRLYDISCCASLKYTFEIEPTMYSSIATTNIQMLKRVVLYTYYLNAKECTERALLLPLI